VNKPQLLFPDCFKATYNKRVKRPIVNMGVSSNEYPTLSMQVTRFGSLSSFGSRKQVNTHEAPILVKQSFKYWMTWRAVSTREALARAFMRV